MGGLNRWQGIMTLGADSELRFTQGGQPVLNFRGACNETYQAEGKEKKEIVTWVPCVLWGKRGEALSKHLVKGTKLYVEGALRIGSYEDKDGNKKTKVEVQVSEIEFVGGKGRSGGDGDAPRAQQNQRGGGYGGQRASAPAGGGYGGGAPAAPPTGGSYEENAEAFSGGDDEDIPFVHCSMSPDLRRWGL